MIGMFKIKEAAMGSVSRRGSNIIGHCLDAGKWT